MGKVIQIKKDQKIYKLDSMPWQIFNRIIGIAFCFAIATRSIAHEMPFLPTPLKNIISSVYKLFSLISNKILAALLLRK